MHLILFELEKKARKDSGPKIDGIRAAAEGAPGPNAEPFVPDNEHFNHMMDNINDYNYNMLGALHHHHADQFEDMGLRGGLGVLNDGIGRGRPGRERLIRNLVGGVYGNNRALRNYLDSLNADDIPRDRELQWLERQMEFLGVPGNAETNMQREDREDALIEVAERYDEIAPKGGEDV